MIDLTFVATVLAGGAGAGLRYVVDALVMRGRPDRFPLGIFLVNVTGSFALSLLLGLELQPVWNSVIGVGLLGGYTTFSAVSVETVLLIQRRRRRRALLNAVGTLAATVAAVGLGVLLGLLITVGY
ncbi:fluoride efflux transporter FluC [Microbacterium fluvii]|uniref:Fluoride-specific ion channel FluC n=1 Tax=Microbacterium fluvii TaxID=415215 RepID=A0ABW2HI39_9MICO|nr:CrcB family protein [Microbacterium fluvii]MCU4673892.1 CrcB family protein [Microbacterium fluvii]